MSENPIDQFSVTTLHKLSLFGENINFTNSSLFMAIAVLIISTLFMLATRKSKIVPSRFQAFTESIYYFVHDTVRENTHGKGEKFFPFVFTIFTFIITLNLLGNAPYGFSVTSQLIVTSIFALIVFLLVTLVGFYIHGLKFLSLFLPEGTPMVMAPLIVVLEIFAYLVRPIALSIRLGANMIAGHILVAVVAGLISILGIWGILPISFIVIFDGFELFVAILQAYIFTILTCVYLNDAINLH